MKISVVGKVRILFENDNDDPHFLDHAAYQANKIAYDMSCQISVRIGEVDTPYRQHFTADYLEKSLKKSCLFEVWDNEHGLHTCGAAAVPGHLYCSHHIQFHTKENK